MTEGEVKMFVATCQSMGLPVPQQEVLFAKERYGRSWRADFMFVVGERKVAVEVEGIFFTDSQGKSRHQTGTGYINDSVKYNIYTLMGIGLLRFTSSQVKASPVVCCKVILQALGLAELSERDIAALFAFEVKAKSRKKK